MARIHARTKGKAGSKKPVVADLSFVSLKAKDVENLVVKLAQDDMSPSVIGITLRDRHAVPDVKKVTGKSISKILSDANLISEIPEDLAALVKKATALKKHLEANTRDVHNKRGLNLVESKIRRLTKYYKKTGRIAQNWSYN